MFREADKKTKDKIATVTIQKPYRCGRFIVSESTIPERHVDFDITASSRVSIATADE